MIRAAALSIAVGLGCGSIDEPSPEPPGRPVQADPHPIAPRSFEEEREAERPPAEPPADGPVEASCPFGYRPIVDGDGSVVCEPPAEPAVLARERFQEGMRKYDEGDYEGALAAFRDVQALHPLPAIAFDIAVTLEHLGRHDEARRELRRLLDDPATPEHVRKMAEERLRPRDP